MPRYQISDELYKLVGQVLPEATPEIPLTPTIQKHKDSASEV